MMVGAGATSQLDLPSLTPLSVAGCGRLELGVPHWSISFSLGVTLGVMKNVGVKKKKLRKTLGVNVVKSKVIMCSIFVNTGRSTGCAV